MLDLRKNEDRKAQHNHDFSPVYLYFEVQGILNLQVFATCMYLVCSQGSLVCPPKYSTVKGCKRRASIIVQTPAARRCNICCPTRSSCTQARSRPNFSSTIAGSRVAATHRCLLHYTLFKALSRSHGTFFFIFDSISHHFFRWPEYPLPVWQLRDTLKNIRNTKGAGRLVREANHKVFRYFR